MRASADRRMGNPKPAGGRRSEVWQSMDPEKQRTVLGR
jgi:hypothetical protein